MTILSQYKSTATLKLKSNQADTLLAVEDSDAVLDDATLYTDVQDLDCDALTECW